MCSEAGSPSVLLLFVDGIGLGPARPGNPFFDHPSPLLERLIGGRLTIERAGSGADCLLLAIDANLGVDGLPQSATGQTTLFTGINAARWMGRHVPAFPGPRLREIIDQHGVLAKVRSRGSRVAFSNAFSPAFYEQLSERKRRASVTVLSAWAAGLELRGLDDLAARRALSWDLERDLVSQYVDVEMPLISSFEAGVDLAAISGHNELTVFETFLPDFVGHGRVEMEAGEVVRRLDGLLAGVVERRPERVTVVMTSDHGNFEDQTDKRHTRNPVPLLVLGPAKAAFEGVESLADVAPAILRVLDSELT